MTRWLNRRALLAAFALAWFWVVALHVATGLFDNLIENGTGRRSGIVGMVDKLVDAMLVEPLGTALATLALLAAGVVAALAVMKFHGGGK